MTIDVCRDGIGRMAEQLLHYFEAAERLSEGFPW